MISTWFLHLHRAFAFSGARSYRDEVGDVVIPVRVIGPESLDASVHQVVDVGPLSMDAGVLSATSIVFASAVLDRLMISALGFGAHLEDPSLVKDDVKGAFLRVATL